MLDFFSPLQGSSGRYRTRVLVQVPVLTHARRKEVLGGIPRCPVPPGISSVCMGGSTVACSRWRTGSVKPCYDGIVPAAMQRL